MPRIRFLLLMALLFISTVCLQVGQEKTLPPPTEGEILSIFPLGGKTGTTLAGEIRGLLLDKSSRVWFDCDQIKAEITKVEEIEIKGDEKDPLRPSPARLGQRVVLTLKVSPSAETGVHLLRMVTQGGISNALTFRVGSEPTVMEDPHSHEPPGEAQAIGSLPVAVNGMLSSEGEVDYYSFEAGKAQELLFDGLSASSKIDLYLALFEPAGSWFDPHEVTRLAFNEEPVSHPDFPTWPRLRYLFHRDGRYLIQVGAFGGRGGPDYAYQLRLRPAKDGEIPIEKPAHPSIPQWQERDFTRKITPEWQQALWSRTVRAASDTGQTNEGQASNESASKLTPTFSKGDKMDPATVTAPLIELTENEPNDSTAQSLELPIPAILRGSIDRPGDVDSFRLKVKSGQQLAFEIETPDARPPIFNPRLGLLDETGQEILANIHDKQHPCLFQLLNVIQAKTIYTFVRDGEFTLQIRDITSQFGNSSFAYRVLIRPQVPHLGKVELKEDHLNLVAGNAKSLSVTTEQEEGYDGFVAISLEDLPEGVQAFPGTEVEPDKPPLPNEGKKERYVARIQKATILLVANRDAPAMEMPKTARIVVRPVVRGKLGEPITVKEILIMVIRQSPCSAPKP